MQRDRRNQEKRETANDTESKESGERGRERERERERHPDTILMNYDFQLHRPTHARHYTREQACATPTVI
jgi:hypothetical protein